MAHTEFGPRLLQRILGIFEGQATIDREARFEGRRYVSVIRGIKGPEHKTQADEKQETGNPSTKPGTSKKVEAVVKKSS